MAIRDFFKLTRKTFLNPTGWLDYGTLVERNKTIWSSLKGLFIIPESTRKETFEEAMVRLNLTEEDVKSTEANYRVFALIFFILGLLVFFYSFYLVFAHGTLTGFLLGVSASGVFFSQAFKYDFWSFQMRRRKLGATFEEWKNSLLSDKGPSS